MGRPVLKKPLQYVFDRSGRETAVQISINDWQTLMEYVADLEQAAGVPEQPPSISGKTIKADELFLFAQGIGELELRTIAKGSRFTVQVINNRLVYTPTTSGVRRFHDRPTLEQLCHEFSRTGSLIPADYTSITLNAAFPLALIQAYLERTGR